MNNNQIIKLDGELTFANAKAKCDHIRNFINSAHTDDIIIDFADVRHSDSAGVALLIEILKIAQQSHKTITFEQLPAQIKSLVRFCNLSKFVEK